MYRTLGRGRLVPADVAMLMGIGQLTPLFHHSSLMVHDWNCGHGRYSCYVILSNAMPFAVRLGRANIRSGGTKSKQQKRFGKWAV